MKWSGVVVAPVLALLMMGCGGNVATEGAQVDEQEVILQQEREGVAASDTAAPGGVVVDDTATPGGDAVTLLLPAGIDGCGREALDALVWLRAGDRLDTGDENGDYERVVEYLEGRVDALPAVAHVSRCKQRLGTGKVTISVDDRQETVNATWLCDIDWPDATFDPNRHIRHWIADQIHGTVAMLNIEKGDTARVYRQALDDAKVVLQHYAGQYARLYKSAMSKGEDVVPYYSARYAAEGNFNLIIKVRAVSDDWVTMYVAELDGQYRSVPTYAMVSINRRTGKLLGVDDVVAKGERAAFMSRAQATGAGALTLTAKTPMWLAFTPDAVVVSLPPAAAPDEASAVSTVAYVR